VEELCAGRHVVLAGDLDATPEAASVELDRRIDYLFVRCDERGPTLDARACGRLFDAPVCGFWASDHYGLVADLEPA
jgi:endonuclease/exonuclease/phosphatase family metal-dependent hydrolase